MVRKVRETMRAARRGGPSHVARRTREVIGRSSVAIPYDNGGGQRGVRRNPAYDGYNALMASYTKAVRQLTDILGAAADAGATRSLDEMLR